MGRAAKRQEEVGQAFAVGLHPRIGAASRFSQLPAEHIQAITRMYSDKNTEDSKCKTLEEQRHVDRENVARNFAMHCRTRFVMRNRPEGQLNDDLVKKIMHMVIADKVPDDNTWLQQRQLYFDNFPESSVYYDNKIQSDRGKA
eukprot:1488581-Rhodomonas_salina.1